MNCDFAEGVIHKLNAAGIAPSRLEVEVTENVFLGSGARSVADTLARFRDAGIQVSLDEFSGTGYASLTHLDQFPLNWVKLDRSFVCRVGMSGKAEAILDGAIKLARSLGLGVVAEGIETEEQHGYLRDAGCELGQGYLFRQTDDRDAGAPFRPQPQDGPYRRRRCRSGRKRSESRTVSGRPSPGRASPPPRWGGHRSRENRV